MEGLDLPAQLFLFRNAAIHPVKIQRNKVLAAGHQLLRQAAQQREALVKQIQIPFDFSAHGLRHFVEFVLVFFQRADLWRIG